MELKEFIKTTLRDIASAVKESQEELQAFNCSVNPPVNGDKADFERGANRIHKIEFNLALSAEDKETSKAGVGIVHVIKAGLSNESTGSTTSNTNLKFDINVTWALHNSDRIREIQAKHQASLKEN